MTRMLIDLCRHVLKVGSCLWYVDDGMGASRRDVVHQEVQAIIQVVCALLGSQAIALDKTEVGVRQSEWKGWRIDLDSRRLSIARHNLLKRCVFSGVWMLRVPSPANNYSVRHR